MRRECVRQEWSVQICRGRDVSGKVRKFLGAVVCGLLPTIAGMFILWGMPAAKLTAHAETVYKNGETSYVVIIEDDANLLPAEYEAELAWVMMPITEYGNVAFKSIDENSMSTERYIEEYYAE